jgi:hypothetical protein
LHSAGYGSTAGTLAALTQSALKPVTQATQLMRSGSVSIEAAHEAAGPGGSTGGQLGTKPISLGVRSSGVPQR